MIFLVKLSINNSRAYQCRWPISKMRKKDEAEFALVQNMLWEKWAHLGSPNRRSVDVVERASE